MSGNLVVKTETTSLTDKLFSDVAKFNEYYAKEFYDLLPDEAIKLFKGVRSTAGDAWRTGQKDLGTYFSTNPHVAALYSAMIGKAKIGEELPMFSIDKRISELKNFLGEGAIRNGSAQGSMEFPQVLGGEDLSRILPNIYSLPGQVYGQMFGATAKSLKEIKNLWPSGFAQGGYVPKFKNGINVVPQDMLAMIHKNESIVPASMNPFNPDAAMPKYNFNRSSFNVRGDGAIGASYTVNQNIYASDGMDVEALSNMIVKKAEVVIGQKAKVNVKMVGQGKNI